MNLPEHRIKKTVYSPDTTLRIVFFEAPTPKIHEFKVRSVSKSNHYLFGLFVDCLKCVSIRFTNEERIHFGRMKKEAICADIPKIK